MPGLAICIKTTRILSVLSFVSRIPWFAPPGIRWRYLMKRGILYHDWKKDDLALSDFDAADDCGPNDEMAWILTWRADVKAILFPLQPERALEDHNRAIDASPNPDAWPLLHRAMTYRLYGRLADALATTMLGSELPRRTPSSWRIAELPCGRWANISVRSRTFMIRRRAPTRRRVGGSESILP